MRGRSEEGRGKREKKEGKKKREKEGERERESVQVNKEGTRREEAHMGEGGRKWGGG